MTNLITYLTNNFS